MCAEGRIVVAFSDMCQIHEWSTEAAKPRCVSVKFGLSGGITDRVQQEDTFAACNRAHRLRQRIDPPLPGSCRFLPWGTGLFQSFQK